MGGFERWLAVCVVALFGCGGGEFSATRRFISSDAFAQPDAAEDAAPNEAGADAGALDAARPVEAGYDAADGFTCEFDADVSPPGSDCIAQSETCGVACGATGFLYTCAKGTTFPNAGPCLFRGSTAFFGTDDVCCIADTCTRATQFDQSKCGGRRGITCRHLADGGRQDMPGCSNDGTASLSSDLFCCP